MQLQLRFVSHGATAAPPCFSHNQSRWLSPHSHFLYSNFTRIGIERCQIRATSDGASGFDKGDTFLDLWKREVERDKIKKRFRRLLENVPQNGHRDGESEGEGDDETEGEGYVDSPEDLERKTVEFKKILDVPKEERDRVQRMQVIDRAAAAIAAARAILDESPPQLPPKENDHRKDLAFSDDNGGGGKPFQKLYIRENRPSQIGSPGPDFWSWVPPPGDDLSLNGSNNSQAAQKPSADANQMSELLEKDPSADTLKIPFETKLYESKMTSSLPPLQSWMQIDKLEVHNDDDSLTILENVALNKDHEIHSTEHAAEAARVLDEKDENPSHGTHPDGSRWWKYTGIERRPDGVLCRWTVVRNVAADNSVESEDKYWEAADDFGYKELGSEKSGRDAHGNVWHEYWRESMWQEGGLMHIEKTADKWGKKGENDEWREKWFEHYDASGRADKWADKWSKIDPYTELEAGHAHVWHERWGEKYDGHGGSDKYTDKWAERYERDEPKGWSKWGDKWDEHFDINGQGVKQGETWWNGRYGDTWNRTWGEKHNGTGWLHKYGRSSCGEQWDTHVQEDTWYQKYPHYGFMHCLENTVQLREVKKPSESEDLQ